MSVADSTTVRLPTAAAMYRYAVEADDRVGVTCPTTGSVRAALTAAETATALVSVYAAPAGLDGLGWPGRYRLAGAVERGDVDLAVARTGSEWLAWSDDWSARPRCPTRRLVSDETRLTRGRRQPSLPDGVVASVTDDTVGGIVVVRESVIHVGDSEVVAAGVSRP
ncbi:hypothetical protein [Halobaculum sp. MBLA0143]|uniref:hypothetical protein n=1 Tax=Halobaculum sp. MBLA0143 TaxID=3079933 RepID=UPI0035248A16